MGGCDLLVRMATLETPSATVATPPELRREECGTLPSPPSLALKKQRDDEDGLVPMPELLSALVHLAGCAGAIIREVREAGPAALAAHNKKHAGDQRSVAEMNPNEVLTVADGSPG